MSPFSFISEALGPSLIPITLVAAALCFLILDTALTRLPLPPSLPQKLISGNLHQIPPTEQWKEYKKWSAQLGASSANQLAIA